MSNALAARPYRTRTHVQRPTEGASGTGMHAAAPGMGAPSARWDGRIGSAGGPGGRGLTSPEVDASASKMFSLTVSDGARVVGVFLQARDKSSDMKI
eukprot:CAMPEP_0181176466 /NCGR_PEP_ID=MMETSP1096-20121128/4645_1 /TAXON_ID=156174 ORGANISM="Chrysochromulina ericina, Strain CCMP281" /NCGR_SAMPLE_ID=MMETSP1096 /ASSEMBLY_ACC=CAM_ASM_000453 /LENGTH=96 /DNA_ID=CAMNT_0023264557 /DNA_START=481 /DNA_END=772 /DNA_ORIENTATION=-